MKKTDYRTLQHIEAYCSDIANTVRRFGADFETFAADYDYRNSIAMSLLEIGELTKNLSHEFRNATIDELFWPDLKDLRNEVAHQYRRMEIEEVFITATKAVPTIQTFCTKYIGIYQEQEKKKARHASDQNPDKH